MAARSTGKGEKSCKGKGAEKGEKCAEKVKDTSQKCSECRNEVGVNDRGIECELCHDWFHASCVGVPVFSGSNKHTLVL